MSNHNKNVSKGRVEKRLPNTSLDDLKKQWRESEESLLGEKGTLGYGACSNDEFIKMHPDPNKGQSENSKFLSLQAAVQELLERQKLLWVEEYVVEELNKLHAVIHTDQFYILTEKTNPVQGGTDFTLESKRSFKDQYENKIVQCPEGRFRTKAEIWLKSPDRREYKGIVFSPHQGKTSNEYYNLWKGFARLPRKGDCTKYWAHVLENICSGDPIAYRYIRKWIAYVFQHPDVVHVALVLCGSQGVGKNSFVEPLGVLLGQHYVLLSNINELVSNFNFHLKYAVLIHANEALWGGNKKDLGTVKAMITEKLCLIEGKGKDRVMLPNFKHLILSSNEDWPVHLDPDDRRFYVLRVSETHKEDHPYFAAIQKQLDEEGYEALLYDLLTEDLSAFNPRVFPQSIEAFEIKVQSAHSVEQYFYEAVKDGCFDVGQAAPNGIWPEEMAKESMFQDYCSWCLKNGKKQDDKNNFCKKVKKLFPSITSTRPRAEDNQAQRIPKYQLSPLNHLREEFQKYFKAGMGIWE